MIKKLATAFGYGLLGLACTLLVNFCIYRIGVAYPGANVFPYCEACNAYSEGMWLGNVIPLLAFAVFAVTGYMSISRKLAVRRVLMVFGTLSAITVYADQTIYTSFLIDHSNNLYNIREIQADDGFAPPVISKTDIQVYDFVGDKLKTTYVMKQWERCAIGDLDEKHSVISINCKEGMGWIKKSDADSLIKLPIR